MDLVEAFRLQGYACGRLGSPMYDELLNRLAVDIAACGPTAHVLRGHEGDAGPSGLALRLAGGVHLLVLSGRIPALAPFYPTTAGTWNLAAAWPVLEQVLVERDAELRRLLANAPQTNEVGRAAALLGGLLLVGEQFDLPVRLFEIGSSGGLNLRADAFCYSDDAGRSCGPPHSPVQLDAWRGRPLPLSGAVEVVERLGSDVAPIDVTTRSGRDTLTAYVWPDQAARHARLAGALELAQRIPAQVRNQDAASFVDGLSLAAGTVTVLWHSVMWQYVPREQQQRVSARLASLGAAATASAPLVHLYAEPVRPTPEADHEFLVCVETWPGAGGVAAGERIVLGDVAPHGVPVVWA